MKILDTIAAISTPHGKGGVALIRISGDDAISVASSCFKVKKKGMSLYENPNMELYGEIYQRNADGTLSCIDDGMAVFFKGPRSFTGEDTVEITCHGGILVTRQVLSSVLSCGARLATAGEFTRRAFINGKLNLSKAEALGKLLDAGNLNQLYLARGGMKGLLTDKTSEIYGALKAMLGNIYARIDFPDEDLSELTETQMLDILSDCMEKISKLTKTYSTGKAINDGIKTVICGRTNAGKSSVYNRLTGDNSAIVTDIEGTTRDILKETVSFGGVTLLLCDTAGLRNTSDAVENIGIERAISELNCAELVLAVFDTSKELSEDDIQLIDKLKGLDCTVIALLNKSDVTLESDKSYIDENFKYKVNVSAMNGDGFDELEKLVNSLFIDGNIDIKSDAVVADARQNSALLLAFESLKNAKESIECGVSLDLCCIDIETAMQNLGALEGREVGEDVVSEIFSKFCVGK